MDASVTWAAASAGTVAVLCGVIAFASWRAVVRTGNKRIQFVVLAFLLLSAKNVFKAVHFASGAPEDAALELVFSLVDLATVVLIAWPLVGGLGGQRA